MGKLLNIRLIRDAMQKRGLNQAQLSGKIDVSRTAVTKWFNGEDFPRPDKLLKLGLVLGLDFKRLVIEETDPFEPVIAFRRKGGHKTTEKHVERAKHMGALLSALAPLLPFDNLVRPATLLQPANEYQYIQRVVRKIRQDIGVAQDAPIHFRDFVDRFASLHTVLIPVLWGNKDHHENALHIYLPESMTTWVYLNLDSNIHDFKFWMAHELGHVHTPDLRENEGEDFADAFAQALLFPEESAAKAYAMVRLGRSEGARITRIKEIAAEFGISPTTVNFSLHAYAHEHSIKPVDAGHAIHAASTNFNKKFPTVSERLFTRIPPSPKEYIAVAREEFHSPFFDVLKNYMRKSAVSTGFVETLLQLPLLDATGVLEELQ